MSGRAGDNRFALLTCWNTREQRQEITLIDATTGQPVRGFTPVVRRGKHFVTPATMSADGRKLAFFSGMATVTPPRLQARQTAHQTQAQEGHAV